MNIAIYSTLNLSHGGGGEEWIKRVALGLTARKHRVLILTTTYGNKHDLTTKETIQKSGIDIMECDIFGSYFPFKLPRPSYFREIVKVLKNFEVLYFNNGFAFNEFFVYMLKISTKIQVISGNHGTFPETGNYLRKMYYQIINRTISRTFDAQHVLNSERERIMKSQGYRNIYRIPNGVDTREIGPAQKKDVFTVMFAGRMTHQKGIDRFVNAVERLNDSSRQDKIRFVICGVGPLSYLPMRLERKYDNVSYLGHASREDLIIAYQTSHLFVAPSRFEEFALVGLEAQAAGTPVLASDVPGPRSLVTNGVTGFLLNTDIPNEMIQMILYFKDLWYDNLSKYQRFCLDSRQNALKYDWNRVLDSLEDMFEAFDHSKHSTVSPRSL